MHVRAGLEATRSELWVAAEVGCLLLWKRDETWVREGGGGGVEYREGC